MKKQKKPLTRWSTKLQERLNQPDPEGPQELPETPEPSTSDRPHLPAKDPTEPF